MIKKSNRLFIAFCLIFLVSLYSGNGGLEGDQRDLDMSDRIDNWGFIVPFVYGEWPNFFGHWRFTLTLLQISVLWFGLYLIFQNCFFTKLYSIIFFAIFIISSFYAANLYRDATLFSLSVLGFGIFLNIKNQKNFLNYFLLITSFILISIASMFKPFYSLVLVLVLLQVIQIKKLNILFKKPILNLAFLFTLIVLFSFPVDNYLSNAAGLQKVYPQQQPIIMDLAAQYCWGTNANQTEQSKNLLSPLLRNEYPPQTICASFRPDSWDNLHTDFNSWVYSSPIIRITGNSESKITNLTTGWIKTIASSPVDWIQVRLYFLGPTLFASNSFTSNLVTVYDENTFLHFLGFAWNILLAPVLMLDKLRLTSLFFAILLCISIMGLKKYRGNKSRIEVIKTSQKIVCATTTCVATIIIGTLISVANNGRYFLPYILLTYIFMLRSFVSSDESLVHKSSQPKRF